MRDHFVEFAHYSLWANEQLRTVVDPLPDDAYRRRIGLFFGSIHGTLNHFLLTDRQWLGRLTGEPPVMGPQDRILFEDRAELAAARKDEERRLVSTIESFSDADLKEDFTYRNTSGREFTQPRHAILSHLLNHQTHHRSQVHTGYHLLTGEEPPTLDLLAFQRMRIATLST